jgi:hypothetical protein
MIAAGLGSRVLGRHLPPFVATYAGDTLCALVLGYGFLWSDLASYVVGVGIGSGITIVLGRPATRGGTRP